MYFNLYYINHSYAYSLKRHCTQNILVFQILDLRDTALGDSEVGCFSSTKTLTHLYLECPSTWRNDESPEVIQHRQQQALRLPIFEDGNLAQVHRKSKERYYTQKDLLAKSKNYFSN